MAGESTFNTPKNLSDFPGQFVVFFSEDENPVVLFNSFIYEEVYKKAEEIATEKGRKPLVIRIQENPQNNIAQILATR
jgi:hypothetical protein